MNKSSFHILRVGMAITFLWIGLLILKFPAAFGGYMNSWAVNLLPVPVDQAMITTAWLDIAIGVFLLIDIFTFWVSVLASFHLAVILAVAGITDITVRDIGLLAGAIALTIETMPSFLGTKFNNSKNKINR